MEILRPELRPDRDLPSARLGRPGIPSRLGSAARLRALPRRSAAVRQNRRSRAVLRRSRTKQTAGRLLYRALGGERASARIDPGGRAVRANADHRTDAQPSLEIDGVRLDV